ncbi:hypothetical protein FACUT_4382 [Fusarium acutatum]|uniref:Uncharacterized protein n=1 Tax=Fusarium acutatum TaxID=78861 RepID=A0A8H4JVJ9_9HYPO|nr:hypothetical protein FACUT_4382 [Fusarium acutatum]
MRSDTDEALKTWFEDYLFWAQKETLFPIIRTESAPHPLCVIIPIQALLHIVCAEWLTFADYINACLNQIDWEISRPAFLPVTQDREAIIDKLRTLRQVGGFESQQRHHRRPVQHADTYGLTVDESDTSRLGRDVKDGPIFGPYKRDYELVLERLVDYEACIYSLSTIVNSTVGLEDGWNTAKSSESMGNLTLITSLFVPPSLIASILGMNTESPTENALKWWAVAAMARWVAQIGEGGKDADADAVQEIQETKDGAPEVNGDGNF